MPLGKGVRYRVRRTKGGKKQRLAFKGNRVIEVKDLGSKRVNRPARRRR